MTTLQPDQKKRRRKRKISREERNAKRHKPQKDITHLRITPGTCTYYESMATDLSHYGIHLVHILATCSVEKVAARLKILLRAFGVGPDGFNDLYERADGSLVNQFHATPADKLIGPCKLFVYTSSTRTNTGTAGSAVAQWMNAADAYDLVKAGELSKRFHAQRMHGDEISMNEHAEFLCPSVIAGRGQGTRAAPKLRCAGDYTSAITGKTQHYRASSVCWKTEVPHDRTFCNDTPTVMLTQQHHKELKDIIDLARIAYATTMYWSGTCMTKAGFDALFFDVQQILWGCKAIVDGNAHAYLVGQNKQTWEKENQAHVKRQAQQMLTHLYTPVKETLQRVYKCI